MCHLLKYKKSMLIYAGSKMASALNLVSIVIQKPTCLFLLNFDARM